MSTRKVRMLLAGLFALLIPVAIAPSIATTASADERVRTIYYDATGAEEFQDAVDAGAKVWNEQAKNVKLEKGGGEVTLTIVADDGWPRAQVDDLGSGQIWMGRQAVNEGHDTIRIAAHEIGHILGLPDDRTGLCEDLMSGASAGPECKNPNPNPKELATVEENFAGTFAPHHFRGVFDETPVAVG